MTAEERAAQSAVLAQTEASHRRLRAVLSTWRHEATERYDALSSRLESDLRLQPSDSKSIEEDSIDDQPSSVRIHKSPWD